MKLYYLLGALSLRSFVRSTLLRRGNKAAASVDFSTLFSNHSTVADASRSLQESAQENGVGTCACSPASYEFTFDFRLTCLDNDITPNDVVFDTTCLVNPFQDPAVTDLIPVAVQSIDILELDQDLHIIAQEKIAGSFADGYTFQYTSITALPGEIVVPNDIPKAIQLNIIGVNQFDKPIINVYLIIFSNICGRYPVLSENQSVGWTRLTKLAPHIEEYCTPTEPPPPNDPPISPEEIGVEICACSPASYEFTFDFSLVCPNNILRSLAVRDTVCEIDSYLDNPRKLIPVAVQSIEIYEIGQDDQLIAQQVLDGPFGNGDTFKYTSITGASSGAIVNAMNIPKLIVIWINGVNKAGEPIYNGFKIEFSSYCGGVPALFDGESAGWTRFTNLAPPTAEYCPLTEVSPPPKDCMSNSRPATNGKKQQKKTKKAPDPVPGVALPSLWLSKPSTTSFNYAGWLDFVEVCVQLEAGAEFGTGAVDFTVNGVAFNHPCILVKTPSTICTQAEPVNGENRVLFQAKDSLGNVLYLEDSFFAGEDYFTITLLNENGDTFLGPVSVTAFLAYNQAISSTVETTTGSAYFSGLPSCCNTIVAIGPNNEIGFGAADNSLNTEIVMHGFNPPAPNVNLDIANADLDGWEGENIYVTPFQENVGPTFTDTITVRGRRLLLPEGSNFERNSLVLSTNFEVSPQHASHTFHVATNPGLKSVVFSLNWRFQTEECLVWRSYKDENPDGELIWEFDDVFMIAVRTESTANPLSIVMRSLTGLGLGAFDQSGSTSRHPLAVELGTDEDIVQLDLWVQNGHDDRDQALIIVDSMVLYEYIETEDPLLTAIRECNQDRHWCAWGKNAESWDSGINDAVVRSHEAAKQRKISTLDKNDLLMSRLQQVSTEKSIPLPLLLALASRESGFGELLGKGTCHTGWADLQASRECTGKISKKKCWGYGVFQIDKCYHGMPIIQAAIDSDGPLGLTHMRSAADIFLRCFKLVEDKFKNGANLATKDSDLGLTWTRALVLKGAVVCYNSGIESVQSISSMDAGTYNNDYGSDIMTQAGWFLNLLSGSQSESQFVTSLSSGDCRTSNNNIAGTCTGYCWTERAKYLRDAIHDCFPGITVTTYPGHDKGNGLDVWVDASGALAKANTNDAVDLSPAHEALIFEVTTWLMENHDTLKIYYLIFKGAIWDPSTDANGVWTDCCSRNCYCVVTEGPDVTQSHHDHLHISVLAT